MGQLPAGVVAKAQTVEVDTEKVGVEKLEVERAAVVLEKVLSQPGKLLVGMKVVLVNFHVNHLAVTVTNHSYYGRL